MGRRPTLSRALSRQASAAFTPYRRAGPIDRYLLAAEPYSMQAAASTVEYRIDRRITLKLARTFTRVSSCGLAIAHFDLM
jgi:hypothetical protein